MKTLALLIAILTGGPAIAQDSTSLDTDTLHKPGKLTLQGYIKDLQTLNFNKDFSTLVSSNQIHNRLNLNWKSGENLKAVMEIRTRLFWGEEIKINPNFSSFLRNRNDKVNLQKSWIDNDAVVLHSNIERLYMDFPLKKIQVRLGRQRINWGITTTWNPNDIFNVYNFLDFDYEERPGVDGAKVHYVFPNASIMEFAYAFAGTTSSVGALKYSLNRSNYDLQFLAGWYKNHPTAGLGWAGYIRDAGFKGEAQYYFAAGDASGRFNLAVEGDYMFDQGWYVNAGFLWNGRGISRPVAAWEQISLDLSPKNLMPTKWNLLITTAKEINPLFQANLGVLYAPGTNLMILIPSFQYNLAPDLDVNLLGQSYFAELNNRMEAVNHSIYLRLKWSF